MSTNEKQYYVQLTGQTIATSPEEAVHIAMDQVVDGSACAEIRDDLGNKWEPDLDKIVAMRRPPYPSVMAADSQLTYDIVFNAARRFAQTLSPEQRDLFAALATADTPERAQIVRDIADAAIARDAPHEAEQLDALLLANVRYAAGHDIGVVGPTVDLAISRWSEMSEATREIVLREVTHALATAGAGMEMVEREWQRLVAHASPTPSPKM